MADILLVEGAGARRARLERALAGMGHTVRAVRDGAAATAAFRQRRPDLLLIDAALPPPGAGDGLAWPPCAAAPEAAPRPPLGTVFHAGPLRVDAARFEVTGPRCGRVPLTLRELDLLRFFARHPGEVACRERLMAEVWGVDGWATTRTLDQHIWVLRRKLGADGAVIETVTRVGYRVRGREAAA